MDRLVIGALILCGALAFILQDSPRLLFEWQHADEYVAAPGLEMVEGECSNWAPIPFSHCEVSYRSKDGKRSGALDDWKFGPEMADTAHLMQWRVDRDVVSSDISLNAITNRLAFAGAVIAFAAVTMIAAILKALSRRRTEFDDVEPDGHEYE